jgi:hypothetical protein
VCHFNSDIEIINHFINCGRKNQNSLYNIKCFLKVLHDIYVDEKRVDMNLVINNQYLQ